MIGYTMVGTKDLARSVRFYDPLFAEMGLEQCWRDDKSVSWGIASDDKIPRFFTGYPFNGEQATVGNGTMTAFRVQAPAVVDRLYAIAMDNGGSDEGKPGSRSRYGPDFYGAYVRDPDGNKLAFVYY